MSRHERYELVKALNWDYQVNPEDLLAVVEGKIPNAGPFYAERLLVRSLERLTWYAVLNLWGLDRLLEIYKPGLLRRIRSSELRRRYEFLFRLLRNEPVSPPGWSAEMRRRIQRGILSHRWYRKWPSR